MRLRLTRMFLAAVVLVSAAFAQGPPASVTSLGFGGNGNKGGGPPASVTSPGFGNTGQNRFFFNPPNNHQFHNFHGNLNPKRHHNFFPQNNFGVVYAVPYYVPLDTLEPVDDTMEQMTAPPTQYLGGPTVFDRRGPGIAVPAPVEPAPREEARAEAEPAPAVEPRLAPDQPQTLLIFKDGHHVAVQNYAIVGDMLYDLTPGHSHKVLLADLDLDATTRQNDERGIDFRLPPHAKDR